MERKIILGILALAFVLFIIAMLIPSGREQPRDVLPWQISVTDTGSIRVFGLHLGYTTIGEAQQKFEEGAKISLFASEQGEYVVEAFFKEVWLAGLKAKMILTADLPQDILSGMYHRGIRMNALEGGGKQIQLHPDDEAVVLQTPIRHITYLPASKLEETLLVRRFGNPAERIIEKAGGAVHLLYPDKGLDIAISTSGKVVLQYLQPRHFDQAILEPLRHQPDGDTGGKTMGEPRQKTP
jgi:hypothetical protein